MLRATIAACRMIRSTNSPLLRARPSEEKARSRARGARLFVGVVALLAVLSAMGFYLIGSRAMSSADDGGGGGESLAAFLVSESYTEGRLSPESLAHLVGMYYVRDASLATLKTLRERGVKVRPTSPSPLTARR